MQIFTDSRNPWFFGAYVAACPLVWLRLRYMVAHTRGFWYPNAKMPSFERAIGQVYVGTHQCSEFCIFKSVSHFEMISKNC